MKSLTDLATGFLWGVAKTESSSSSGSLLSSLSSSYSISSKTSALIGWGDGERGGFGGGSNFWGGVGSSGDFGFGNSGGVEGIWGDNGFCGGNWGFSWGWGDGGLAGTCGEGVRGGFGGSTRGILDGGSFFFGGKGQTIAVSFGVGGFLEDSFCQIESL